MDDRNAERDASRYAAPGKIWFCMACGKRSRDMHGGSMGWNEACTLNCIEIDEHATGPDAAAAQAFHVRRNARLDTSLKSLAELFDKPRPPLDPETAARAQAALDRIRVARIPSPGQGGST